MVYVVDRNHKVQVLNSDFTFSGKFGSYGSGQGQFNDPHGVACDSNGKVYVADTRNHRIQVFTANMAFLMFFDDAEFKLRYPSCVAFNPHSDYVFVSQKDKIHLFSSKGHNEGSLPGGGKLCGVASDNEFLYVCTDEFLHVGTKDPKLCPKTWTNNLTIAHWYSGAAVFTFLVLLLIFYFPL